MVVGVLVWGLMLWVVVRYRRRSDDEIPVQTRYNVPLEILYTIAPVVIVIVFFARTVRRPARPDQAGPATPTTRSS